MKRFEELPPAQMSAEQLRVVAGAVAGARGRVPVPMQAWLHSPELADRAQRLGEFARYQTTLAGRLSELAILVVARTWTAQYEWFAHRRDALKAGLGEDVIAAIAVGREPEFAADDEALVYAFSRSVMLRYGVDDGLYARATEVLGAQGVVELVGILGYYTLVAMTLNVFEMGDVKELEPLVQVGVPPPRPDLQSL